MRKRIVTIIAISSSICLLSACHYRRHTELNVSNAMGVSFISSSVCPVSIQESGETSSMTAVSAVQRGVRRENVQIIESNTPQAESKIVKSTKNESSDNTSHNVPGAAQVTVQIRSFDGYSEFVDSPVSDMSRSTPRVLDNNSDKQLQDMLKSYNTVADIRLQDYFLPSINEYAQGDITFNQLKEKYNKVYVIDKQNGRKYAVLNISIKDLKFPILETSSMISLQLNDMLLPYKNNSSMLWVSTDIYPDGFVGGHCVINDPGKRTVYAYAIYFEVMAMEPVSQ